MLSSMEEMEKSAIETATGMIHVLRGTEFTNPNFLSRKGEIWLFTNTVTTCKSQIIMHLIPLPARERSFLIPGYIAARDVVTKFPQIVMTQCHLKTITNTVIIKAQYVGV